MLYEKTHAELQASRSEAALERGLREAAVKTNAWVITDGISDSVSALAGRALRDVDVPLLGITPWNSIADRAALDIVDQAALARACRSAP